MSIHIGKRELIWSFVGITASLLSNIVMIPLMMHFLDGDSLGLWYVFQSIGAIAILFDFGFSPSFARNVAYCWSGASILTKTGGIKAENDDVDFTLLYKILAVCKRIYLYIAVAALLLCATVGSAYILYLGKETRNTAFLTAWLIYTTAIFLNLYYGYFASFLRGVGAVAQANRSTVLARMIQLAAMVILLIFGYGMIAASLAYLLYGLSFRVLAKRAFYRYEGIGKKLNGIKRNLPLAELWGLFKVIWPNSWKAGVVSLSDYLLNQAGTIICSFYFTLTQTADYSLSVQCVTAIATIASAAYTAYQPSLQRAFITRNLEKSRGDMSLIVASYIVLFIIGMAGFIWIVMPLLSKIKSDVSLTVPIVLATGGYQFLLKLRNCYTSYLSCTNRLTYTTGFVTAAIICIVLSLFMAGTLRLGVWGLIAAQILSHCVYNLWKWPLQIHRELRLGFGEMWRLACKEMKGLLLGKG